jgi:hypothetical protein
MTGAGGTTPSPLVLDAMCLNHFARVDRLDVLRELLVGDECGTTYVVLEEVRRGVSAHPALQAALELEWLSVIRIESLPELDCFAKWMGSPVSGGWAR